MNVTAPFRRLARMVPDTPAIVTPEHRTITYGQLDRMIDGMVERAARAGLRAGDVAGLSIPPGDAAALVLALGLARMGVVTAAPTLPPAMMTLHFQHGTAAAPGCVAFDASWLTDGRPETPILPDADAICRIFASSGTTGEPKHIPISHALLGRRMLSYALGLGVRPVVRMVCCGLGMTWGFSMALRTLWFGGTLVLPNARDMHGTARRHRVASIIAAPSTLQAWLTGLPDGAETLPTLDTIEAGGSMLPERLAREVETRLGGRIVSYLGSSEAGPIAAAPMNVLVGRPGAAGYAFADVEVQAVDEQDTPLPPGAQGVLRIRSPSVAPGYLGGAAGPGWEGFRDGWFYPGDRGSVGLDGLVTLNGRASEVINCGGVKISPHAIEAGLLAMPSVRDAAAFGVPDAGGVSRVWAAIVTDVPVDDAALDAFCDTLPEAMAPEIVLQIKEMPRNDQGKLMRDRLVELARAMTAGR